jgi:hypothetical protein
VEVADPGGTIPGIGIGGPPPGPGLTEGEETAVAGLGCAKAVKVNAAKASATNVLLMEERMGCCINYWGKR